LVVAWFWPDIHREGEEHGVKAEIVVLTATVTVEIRLQELSAKEIRTMGQVQ